MNAKRLQTKEEARVWSLQFRHLQGWHAEWVRPECPMCPSPKVEHTEAACNATICYCGAADAPTSG